MKLFIIITFIIIFIILILNCIILYFYLLTPDTKKEQYTNIPLLIYNVELNTTNVNIIIPYLNYSSKINDNLSNIKNINVKLLDINNTNDYINTEYSDNILLLTDTFNYVFKYPHYKVLTVINNDKNLLFLKKQNHISDEKLIDIINNKKIIGYTNDTELLLLIYLCISMGINKNILNTKKVSIPTKINNDYFDTNKIDVLILFIPLSNNKVINTFDNDFLMDFLQYEDFDINILKFLIPYVKINNTDLTIPFKKYKNSYPIKTCFSFDMLLCGDANLDNNDDLGLKFNKIIVRFENFDVINYYTMFFSFYKQTIAYLEQSNQHVIQRDNLPILEQFTNITSRLNVKFDIEPDKNIDGFYNIDDKTLLVKFNNINNIPLSLFSRINLQNQDRLEENGIYFVKYTDHDTTILQKYLIYTTNNPIDNSANASRFINISNETHIQDIPIDNINPDDLIYIENINEYSNIFKKNKQIYLKLINIPIDNPTYDSRYSCYNDPQIKSRGLCESDYDTMGQIKTKKNYWDKPCENNEDCPFYQANKNYPNYFGGCIDNRCQFPIGMKPITYQKYDPEFKPMCYNCKDPTDVFCCEEQKDRKQYPELNSPDYSFSLDLYSRMNSLKGKDYIKWYNH